MLRKLNLALALLAGSLAGAAWLRAEEPEQALVTERKPDAPPPQLLAAQASDGRIAFVAARLLERYHYRQHPLDDEYSERFFERYLDAFDPQHVHFTAADLAGFDHYRTNLDDLTLSRKENADTSPAYEIFKRYLERLEQRVAYTDELLKAGKFEFDTDERMATDRREAAYPEDLAEARQFWRQRLRYDYLQERLGRIEAKKKKEKAKFDFATKSGSPAPASKAPSPTAPPAEAATTKSPKKSDHEEIVELLTARAHRNLRMLREWDHDDVMQVYLTALAHAYDPHSDYFNLSQAENFSIGMNLSLFGIGAELRSEEGYCTISKLVPGGPAAKSGRIHEKDRIVAVAQSNAQPVDVVDMALNKAVQMIRGPKGTEVRLTVIRGEDSSDREVVTLIRDKINLREQWAKSKVFDLPGENGTPLRVGVIDLPSFYAPMDLTGSADGSELRYASSDVAQLVKKLKKEGVQGIVLDLRRNGGGSLEECIKLTGLFIKEGPVVQVRGHDGGILVDKDTDDSVLYDGPLIVLTSRFSASASEILAGALQDYGRALIVGDLSTHGKGTVQNVNQLRPYVRNAVHDPGTLKLTIRMFFRPSGASTQKKGVLPDIVLPSVWNHYKDIGEAALEYPLEWDPIRSAKFEKLGQVEPWLPELLRRSNDRVAADPEFNYIREDIAHYRKNQADKTVSLNERERLREKEELDARQETRRKERLARKETDQKIYELTLAQVDDPGLTPVAKTNASAAQVRGASGTVAAITTNSASVIARPAETALNSDGSDDDEKPPDVDATLEETKRILADYVSLLAQKGPLAAGR